MFYLHVHVCIEMMWIIFELKNCLNNDHIIICSYGYYIQNFGWDKL